MKYEMCMGVFASESGQQGRTSDDDKSPRTWTIETGPSEYETMPCLCCDLGVDLDWRKKGLIACQTEAPIDAAREWASCAEWRSNIIEERGDAARVRCPRCQAEFFLTLNSRLFNTSEKAHRQPTKSKGRRKVNGVEVIVQSPARWEDAPEEVRMKALRILLDSVARQRAAEQIERPGEDREESVKKGSVK